MAQKPSHAPAFLNTLGGFFRRSPGLAARVPDADPPPLRQRIKTWSESVADVDPTLRVFVAAASDVDGVTDIFARTAGPRLSLILLVEGRDWTDVVDELEPRLRPLYLSGLSSFDYDVLPISQREGIGSGYTSVYDREAPGALGTEVSSRA